MNIGQVVGGSFGNIMLRQKSGSCLEIGDLLVSEEDDHILILQIFDLEYGSQMNGKVQEMMSGVILEEQLASSEFYEPDFVNYILARVKILARINTNDTVVLPKGMPKFFNKLRMVATQDLKFLQKEDTNKIFVGNIRSGSKVLYDAEVWLDAFEIFSHHVLIPATTGRGKSNLVKTILYYLLYSNNVGALVLDAHDEYYGQKEIGLKDHPNSRDNLVYYTPMNPPPGSPTFIINLNAIRPDHFDGIIDFSEPQDRKMREFYSKYKGEWISELMLYQYSTPDSDNQADANKSAVTINVLQQKLRQALDLKVNYDENIVLSKHNVFDKDRGDKTINQIVNHIESGKVVVLDTSNLSDDAELIVGSIIASSILDRYKSARAEGRLHEKPVATIVIEEAPRVIGDDVLKSGINNIYSTIAREGRKFQVGLTAITQLTSVIPKVILANMNTKIILGNEMKLERQAIIESASQDLSEDDHNIASLDLGEAIISSIYVPFALPIKIPNFKDVIKKPPDNKPKMRVF